MRGQKRDRKSDNRKLFAVFLSVTLIATGIDFSSYAQLAEGYTTQEETEGSEETEQGTVTETEEEQGSEAGSEGESGTETGTGEGAGTEEGTGTETGTGEESGTETGTEEGSGTETGTEEESGTGTETGTEEGTGTETGTEEGTETGTETETETEEDSEEASIYLINRFEASNEILTLAQKGTLKEATDQMPRALSVIVSKQESPDIKNSIKLAVTWTCEQDYENTNLESYQFYPTWDAKHFQLSDGMDKTSLPQIKVVFGEQKEDTVKVDSAKKLQEAIDSSKSKIELASDISLDSSIKIPRKATLSIDGKGYSMLRGKNAQGDIFVGTMLYIDGDISTDNIGELTLQDIQIDGGVKGKHSNAPAIINHGKLILEDGAVIRNNENDGTIEGSITKSSAIKGYGGAILVYGELDFMKGAQIIGNYAEERGGGVYLAEKAILSLYADGFVKNKVGEGGLGADIYASSGSIIYYDSTIDMEREGFFIDAGAILINMQNQLRTMAEDDSEIEIYINVDPKSGYSFDELQKLLQEKLGELGKKVKILTPKKTNVSTTDLRNWNVYDHYEAAYWGTEDKNGDKRPDKWEEYYKGSLDRGYYPFMEPCYLPLAPITDRVTNIKDWLGNPKYLLNSQLHLAQFQEHIYTRTENGLPEMTFAGYGTLPYVDFLFYNPKSPGEKVVDFDVDSSAVNTHTLIGNGFLVNAGLNGKLLSGYLVFYDYSSNNIAYRVSLYEIKDVNVESFHEGKVMLPEPLAIYDILDWQSKMSIQIVATPTKIEVRQQPKSTPTDIKLTTPIIAYGDDTTLNSNHSGFGPLVRYNSHGCTLASSFTYSNLRMYFTNPEAEEETLLNAYQEADFTQDEVEQGKNTRRYFLNLLGEADVEYNATDSFNQYQAYLKLMQEEGVSLITDRDTPFDGTLGASGSNNLLEIKEKIPDLDDLVGKIADYLNKDLPTNWDKSLSTPPLKEAESEVSAGNIWLRGPDEKQLRGSMNADKLPDDYKIKVEDISYKKDGDTPTYYIQKPGDKEYTTLVLNEDGTFAIENNVEEWPAGEYIIKVEYAQADRESPIHGYSYFELTRTTDKYSLKYDANGGIGEVPSDSDTYFSRDTAPVEFAPLPTMEGKEFRGWSHNSADKNPSYIKDSGTNSHVKFRGEDITLYAIWEKDGFDVEGEVEEDPPNPVVGAEVRVIRGNTQYGQTAITNEEGKYKIFNVPTGTYNVVVTKGGKIVTEAIEVEDKDVEVGKIKLPTGITNSVLKVMLGTPDIVVGKLNELFPETITNTDDTKGYTAEDKVIVDAEGKTEFIFTAEEKVQESMTAEELKIAESLERTAQSNGQKIGMLLDLTLMKSVQPKVGDAVATPQVETPLNLEVDVFLPRELMEKQNYKIYRYHDNTVDLITFEENEGGEKMMEEVTEELIFTAHKFSLYAIAFDDVKYPEVIVPEVIVPEETDPEVRSGRKSSSAVPTQVEQLLPVAVEEAVVVTVPVESGYDEEPKTSDSSILLMPVAMGATTSFMLKILLWLYELEFGITEERKNEMIQSLAKWAYGKEKIKVYLAVGCMALVLMLYHLSKIVSTKVRQLGDKFH